MNYDLFSHDASLLKRQAKQLIRIVDRDMQNTPHPSLDTRLRHFDNRTRLAEGGKADGIGEFIPRHAADGEIWNGSLANFLHRRLVKMRTAYKSMPILQGPAKWKKMHSPVPLSANDIHKIDAPALFRQPLRNAFEKDPPVEIRLPTIADK